MPEEPEGELVSPEELETLVLMAIWERLVKLENPDPRARQEVWEAWVKMDALDRQGEQE